MATIKYDVKRSGWGAKAPKYRTSLNWKNVGWVIVHYPGTETTLGTDTAKIASALRGWQNYHMSGRGWSDIAYSVGVDQAGRVYELRGTEVWDGATKNMGGKSVSILAIYGNKETPSAAMKAKIREIALALKAQGSSTCKVSYHQAFGNTSCPGAKLIPWLKQGMPMEGTTTTTTTQTPLVADVAFRAASYNIQAKEFGGGAYEKDRDFIKKTLKPSVLFLQEADSTARGVITQGTNYKIWALNKVAVLWDSTKYNYGKAVELDIGTKHHGLIGRELVSKINGLSFMAVAAHVRSNASYPSNWTSSQKQKAKLDDVKRFIKLLDAYPNVVLGIDQNTSAARNLFLEAGYRQATPNADTMVSSGSQPYDAIYLKGSALVDRTGGKIYPGESDHHGLLANLTLKVK